jgi:vacuolar-type H+-ATPase subunit H
MANTTSTIKKAEEKVGNLGEKARETATTAADKARETATAVTDKAREMASNVGQKAGEMASNFGQQAECATGTVASGMKSLAETIRGHAPEGGMLRSASTAVADSLESGGRYLQEEGLSGLGNELSTFVRRNPLPALFVGIAFGFLIARATSRS